MRTRRRSTGPGTASAPPGTWGRPMHCVQLGVVRGRLARSPDGGSTPWTPGGMPPRSRATGRG
eukprot:10649790-Alexandrium_andersonii.AAC.1